MPASEEDFIADRRGNRLERYSFEVAADGRSHRLLLRASPEIVSQFLSIAPGGPAYRLLSGSVLPSSRWTHCLESAGTPDARARDLAELLGEVITLPRLSSIDFAIAMNWYKVPADGGDPHDWRNTPDGERVHVGKYWTASPEAMAQAGRSLATRLLRVVHRHPALSSTDAVVAVPGHDRTYLSFGERIGASVANALGLSLIKVTTSEFRPPAKDLPGPGREAARGEFLVEADLTGASAMIVDDVFRTGGTMSTVGSAALKAGAARASGLVAVRTMRR